MKLFQKLLPFFLLLTGCASVKHTKVDSGVDNNDGVRYYNSSPYLLVYTNGKGGLVTQILFIADPEKKMSVKVNSFLASAQTTMEFTNGVYKNAKSTIDATAVPQAMIKAIQAAGSEFLSVANAPAGAGAERSMPAPHLYRILINGNTVSFIGGEGDTPIHVNLLEPDKNSPPAAPGGGAGKTEEKKEEKKIEKPVIN